MKFYLFFHVLIMIHNLIVFQFWKELFPLFHYSYLHCWSRYSYVSILFFKFKILTINFCQKSEKSHDYYSCLPPIVCRVKIKVKIPLKSSSHYPLFQRVFQRVFPRIFPIFFLSTESVEIGGGFRWVFWGSDEVHLYQGLIVYTL